MMSHFGMSFQEVKNGTSFKNLLMLAGSVPSYKSKDSDEKKDEDEGQHLFTMAANFVNKNKK